MLLAVLFTFFGYAASSILSDSGCACTTPGGCSVKMDWTSKLSKWCVINGSCGTTYPGFGQVDSCANAGFPSTQIQQPPLLEWDQGPMTFYTGQTLNLLWTSVNISGGELLRITYKGGSLTINNSANFYSFRISDTVTVTTATPLLLASATTPAVSTNTSQAITIIQSKVQNLVIYDGTGSLLGSTEQCNNQNLTVMWRGLGSAQLGTATVTVKSNGGGGGGGTTVGTPIVIRAAGNVTVNYTLPRSFVPSGFTSYTVQINVNGTYTAASTSFQLTAAPSTTPSVTPSVTPSLSNTPTQTPTQTATPTPTQTATPTPTQSQTPAASLDLLAITRAAQEATLAPILGGIIGGIASILFLIGVYIYYQRRQVIDRKRRALEARRGAINRYEESRRNVYGMNVNGMNVNGMNVNGMNVNKVNPSLNQYRSNPNHHR